MGYSVTTPVYIQDILENSITRAESEYTRPVRGAVRMLISYSEGGMSTVLKNLPDLPVWWSHTRDYILSSTVQESHWAQAVGISIMKMASRSWDIDGNVPFVRKERARTIIRGYDYVGQVQRGFADYILRDNGWHIEVVRASDARGSRVLGLNYLSSSRCWPTGNPEIPVVYWDRLGKFYELRAHQVIRLVDAPDGNNMLGIGMCAARRAYNDIREMAAIKRYKLEKVTGARPLSLFFVTGVTNEQIESTIADARQKREAEGIVAFGGVAIGAFIQREGISKVEIPLASLPDQFDSEKEDREINQSYARALPLVTTIDLQAMPGNSRVGTASQSQIADDAAISKETVLDDFTQKVNNEDIWHVLPTGTMFYFRKNDIADRKREADIAIARVNAAAIAVEKMGLVPERAVEWLVEHDVFPDGWSAKAGSDTGTLSVSENVSGQSPPEAITQPVQPKQLPAPANDNTSVATKESDEMNFMQMLALVKATQQPAQNLTMQFPETIAVKAIASPTPIVNVSAPDMQPIAEAITATNEMWANGIKQLARQSNQRDLADALYQLAETVSQQKAPTVEFKPQISVPAPQVSVTNEVKYPSEETREFTVTERDSNNLFKRAIEKITRKQ